MAFTLPQSEELKSLYDAEQLAAIGNREYTVSLFDARTAARRMLDNVLLASVAFIIVTAAGSVELVSFSRTTCGGQKHVVLWTFGQI